ncbi:hypothetical protein RI054_40g147420 [Pseudoscourfieldia marina]
MFAHIMMKRAFFAASSSGLAGASLNKSSVALSFQRSLTSSSTTSSAPFAAAAVAAAAAASKRPAVAQAAASRAARSFASSAAAASEGGGGSSTSSILLGLLGGGAIAYTAIQFAWPGGDDFFEYKFTTKKKGIANDLAEFYHNEDFMQIFCILPIAEQIMMRGSYFDDEGVVHTQGIPIGEMLVSMDFEEEEDEVDGEDTVVSFTKVERFKTHIFGFTLWDMWLTFGYTLNPDGTCEIVHRGKSFWGMWPMKLVFMIHGRIVNNNTATFVNSDGFGNEDADLEELEHARKNIPVFMFNQFITRLERDIERTRQDAADMGRAVADYDKTLEKLRKVKTMQPSLARQESVAGIELKRQGTAVLRSLVINDDEAREAVNKALAQRNNVPGKKRAPSLKRLPSKLGAPMDETQSTPLEVLFSGMDSKYTEGAPMNGKDRELAMRIAERKMQRTKTKVAYKVTDRNDHARPIPSGRGRVA